MKSVLYFNKCSCYDHLKSVHILLGLLVDKELAVVDEKALSTTTSNEPHRAEIQVLRSFCQIRHKCQGLSF